MFFSNYKRSGKDATSQYDYVKSPTRDLRSPFTQYLANPLDLILLRQGFFIMCLRQCILLSLDIGAISIAWKISEMSFTTQRILIFDHTAFISFIISILSLMSANGLYNQGLQWHNFEKIFRTVFLGVGIGGSVLLVHQPIFLVDSFSMIQAMLIFGVANALIASAFRLALMLALRKSRAMGLIRRSAFLICDANECTSIMRTIAEQRCYVVKGVASAKALDLDNRAETLSLLKAKNIDEVFISWDTICNRLFLRWHFQKQGITLNILPTSFKPLLWQGKRKKK